MQDGGQPQARLGAGPQPQAALPPGANGQGPAAAGSITASLQTAIEELTLLATDLATDMSFEVRTLSRGVGPLPPRLNFESGDESS
ncbi:hypothetical protein HaLaN_07543 [Haematococcus lacustris]|uniref:Uncharacterized protein n=1 Tax=Haematococcus lacustris TaxID=44745 RepID=A0A699YWJ2_HAELA|nr:hypothetical protein HaLaN_07543 [Haematococcus lacustris]